MFRFFSSLLGLLGLFLLSTPAFARAETQSSARLLFQVRTNQDPHKLYEFYAITEGPQQRIVSMRYLRKTMREIKVFVGKGEHRTTTTVRRYVDDLCYPIDFPFQQIREGIFLLRHRKVPTPPVLLSSLVERQLSGIALSTSETQTLGSEMRSYCERFLYHQTGRYVNSIRGYGSTPTEELDPLKGGKIVVTFLNNGITNWLKGDYKYVVLDIKRRPSASNGSSWALTTAAGHDASKLFFRTYALGIASIELGLSAQKKPVVVPAIPCKAWIDPKRGTCNLTPQQRSSL